ncbi:MAG: hypothetical protein A3K60_03100 [Euryarchaeota archaeon RBG_19FT_COMBO_56_21]|nr:MAG: hypothetical protein A3K60_03100 [Euryarchaeota archaeon RBG_19FT_COMBO_56_21]
MKRFELALLVGLFLLVASLLPVANHGQAATAAEEGDYWTYESDTDIEGMSLSGSIKMKVTGTEGSGAAEAYVIGLSGSGDLSGSYSSYSVSGSVTYSGVLKRLVSNFSLVSSDLEIKMSMTMQGETVDMIMGILQTYSPALDDYIGDTLPVHGATIVSHSNVTTTTTIEMDMLGQQISDSDTSTYNATQTIQIAASNETVSVPAGEFDCYKYTLTLDLDGDIALMTYHYSSDVGNYVKAAGSGDFTTGFGDSELKSYSYAGKGTGASSLFSGTNLLIIMIVIVVVVVVVLSVVLMMRKRGGAQMPMMPPPETGAPPPPPPPGP